MFYVSADPESRLLPNHRTTADLVVEVISPGSAIYDRNTKADTYALVVKESWLVDEVAETVEIRYEENSRYNPGVVFTKGEKLVSRVLPAIDFEVSRSFED